MNWKELTSIAQLDEIEKTSFDHPVAIFKHSTRCGISTAVKRKFERDYDQSDEQPEIYYLDLLNHRDVSNEIATRYGVEHQSPQIVVLKEGKSIHDASHHMVNFENIDSL